MEVGRWWFVGGVKVLRGEYESVGEECASRVKGYVRNYVNEK